jgi:hypothetical protein
LDVTTGVAVADHAIPAPPPERGSDLDDDVKQAIDQVANALQVSTFSRRDPDAISERHSTPIDLEGAASRAVSAMKRLQPKNKNR